MTHDKQENRMSKPVNIPTRYALIKRMEKLLKEIDDYFEVASSYGLSVLEADPGEVLIKIRAGLIKSLQNEGRLRKGVRP